jgi:Bacterial transcriptional activator domain
LAEVNAAEDEQPAAGLVHRSNGYVLRIDPQIVDLHRFRHLVFTAQDRTDGGRAELLHKALELWRGPALATLQGGWPARMRESWASERLDAAVEWARTTLRLGHPARAIGPVRALLTDYPLA